MERERLHHQADLSLPVQRACPPLHQSLVGSPLPGHTWSPWNLKCLQSFHLVTFGDLIYWNRVRTCWSWREINGPQALQGALHTLTLPTDTAVPLFPGQAWHFFSSGDFLSGATDITERFFPPVVFPPRGGTPSRSFTAAGSSHIRSFLLLKERSFVLRPVLSCTMAVWPPTTGIQRSSVRGMLGLPLLH